MKQFDIADRLIRAIEAGDPAELRTIYAEDAKIWHNFDNVEQSVDENLATLEWLVQQLPERRYEIVRRELLPDGFLQQHVLRGKTPSGAEFSSPACIICQVKDGRIARIDEYLDMASATAQFAG